nr:hypothetical protein CFP56_23899 [Quercus suber]
MCTEGLRAIPECCGSRTQFASDQAHDRQVATQRSESGYEEEREGGYRRAANVFLQHSSRNDRKQRKRAPTRSRYNRLPVGQAARPLLVTCARLKEQNHPGGSSTMPKPRWASDRTVDQDPIEKRAKSTFPCRRRLLRCASGHCKHTTRSSACHPRHGCFYPNRVNNDLFQCLVVDKAGGIFGDIKLPLLDLLAELPVMPPLISLGRIRHLGQESIHDRRGWEPRVPRERSAAVFSTVVVDSPGVRVY